MCKLWELLCNSIMQCTLGWGEVVNGERQRCHTFLLKETARVCNSLTEIPLSLPSNDLEVKHQTEL